MFYTRMHANLPGMVTQLRQLDLDLPGVVTLDDATGCAEELMNRLVEYVKDQNALNGGTIDIHDDGKPRAP
jgi:hypothetical protein